MTVDAETRKEPKTTLQDMEVHSDWARHFRSGENDAFYELAFDYVAEVFGQPDSEIVIDVGCGTGTKSFELAMRGYQVHALDFSATVLAKARVAAAERGLLGRLRFDQGDLTALPLQARSVRRAICWGVLMHVPDIDSAVKELARIIAPGGTLIISEGNMHSLQAVSLRWLKRALRRERAELVVAPAGIEFWEETSTTRLMTRQANIPWLIGEFERHGLELVERRAGQFTEIYVALPVRFLRSVVHACNNLWFRWFRAATIAHGNILILRRPRL